jgi:hypothetical protein
VASRQGKYSTRPTFNGIDNSDQASARRLMVRKVVKQGGIIVDCKNADDSKHN